jgi:serine/threonine protein kinase
MLMEYVAGGSLRRTLGDIDRQKRLSVSEAVKITMGVLEGIALLHSAEVFHRDIKPENVLMDNGTPKVGDFGISCMLSADELARRGAGTILYMAPECFGGQGASFSADIWSTGVMLYEMVTGRLPFGNARMPEEELKARIRQDSPRPSHEVCPDVPRALSDIIARALSKLPGKRYSARAMYDALECFTRGDNYELQCELAAIRSLTEANARPEQIEARLKRLVADYESDPRPYNELGEFYNRRQAWGDAESILRNGIERDSSFAELHYNLGLTLEQTKDLRGAVSQLSRAKELGLDPDHHSFAEFLIENLQGKSG